MENFLGITTHHLLSLTSYDYIAIGICVFSMLFGFIRGMTREFFTLLAWILASAGTFYGIPILQPLIHQVVFHVFWSHLIAGSILFVLILGLFLLMGDFFTLQAKNSVFQSLDRLLGLVFGCVRGLLIVCVAIWGVLAFAPLAHKRALIQRSHFIPMSRYLLSIVKDNVPKDYSIYDPFSDDSLSQKSEEKSPLRSRSIR